MTLTDKSVKQSLKEESTFSDVGRRTPSHTPAGSVGDALGLTQQRTRGTIDLLRS